MARPLRITFPGAFYHVTSRGNEQKPVFKSKKDREKFLEYLESATERYGALIHAFCLMDNHYHLLLETPHGNLPQIMHHINGAYTTYFNTKWKRSGHLFQGRYHSILVEKDAYAEEISRYIHLNPVRAGIVKRPGECAWSSYNYYVGVKKAPEWLHRDHILAYFGKKLADAQEKYKKFVLSVVENEYDSPLKSIFASTVLGSDKFIQFIKERYVSDREADKNLPALRQLTSRVTMQRIFEEVDGVFKADPRFSRNLKIHLCHRLTSETLRSIGEQFGLSESAASHAGKRAQRQIDHDEKTKRKVLRIEKMLKNASFKT